MTSSNQHPAAFLKEIGKPLVVENRPTPTPGPDELLIGVKALAFNLIDQSQRDNGFPPLAHMPAIIGSDTGGIVLAAGSKVPDSAPKVGDRVTAAAPTFFKQGDPDYGAMQAKVLVPAYNAALIPDSMSFAEAATLPMQVTTVLNGWYVLGLSRDTKYKPADKQGLLVWGAASSMGSGAVQSARMMGFTVYSTASEKHHEYIKSLGASRVFDYKDPDVVDGIVKAAKENGLTFSNCYCAVMGALAQCGQVLSKVKGEGKALIASAPPPNLEPPLEIDGVEARFIVTPPQDERDEHFQYLFNYWLKDKLAKGEFVPSPKIKMVGKGLEAANGAIDELKAGVSGTKLVIEI